MTDRAGFWAGLATGIAIVLSLAADDPRATSCVDPVEFGAVPNDGAGDRVGFQSAIDAGRARGVAVCVGPGRWDIEKDPAPGAVHIPSLKIAGDGVTFVGAGESQTVIAMIGGKVGDWTLLDITGSHHRVSGIYFDGSTRGQTDSEQTHLVQISGPATDIVLEHLRMYLPQQPGNHGGDCLRFLGNEPIDPTKPQELIDGVSVSDVWMPECDRSGIGVQRGVKSVSMRGVRVRKAGDQALDMEPTGNGEIRSFYFRDGVLLTGHGGIGVTLTGNNTDARDLLLEGVEVDGQIFMYRVADTTLRNLRVVVDGLAPVAAIKEGDGIRIEGGYYERTDATKPGPVLSFSTHAGSFPTDVVIEHAEIVQRTDAPAVKADPMVGFDMTGGSVRCAGPTANSAAAILGTSVGAPADDVNISKVKVRGTCKYGVQIQGGTTGAGVIHLDANTWRVGTAGFRYDGTAPTARPQVDGNTLIGPLGTAPPIVSPSTLQFTGAN